MVVPAVGWCNVNLAARLQKWRFVAGRHSPLPDDWQCTTTLIFARLVKLWMWCSFQSCRSCFNESTVLKAVAFWLILALTRARRLCLATAQSVKSFAFSLLHLALYPAWRGSGPVTKALFLSFDFICTPVIERLTLMRRWWWCCGASVLKRSCVRSKFSLCN